MPERSIEENLRISLARVALVAMSLQDFSAMIIGHTLRGGTLDDAAFAQIRATAVQNLKNSQATGLSAGDEAEAFRESIGHLEEWIDSAIARGRHLAEG